MGTVMQSEVGYLFSGLWRGEGEKGEEQRGREGARQGKREREKREQDRGTQRERERGRETGVVWRSGGLRPWHPTAHMASLCPEIITRKLYSFFFLVFQDRVSL